MATVACGDLVDQRFEIESFAGTGGMGMVFRARGRNTGKPVAIKILNEREHSSDSGARFVREALLLSQLSHPGIVTYVGLFGGRRIGVTPAEARRARNWDV